MIRNSAVIIAGISALAVFAIACGKGDGNAAAVPVARAQTADGCSPARAHSPAGDARGVVMSSGVEREYLLHVPASYDGTTRVPLVLSFHGAGVNAQVMSDLTGLSAAAEERGVIVVYPEGTGEPQTRLWSALGSPAPVVDTRFAADLIAQLTATLCVDPARVYASGFSLGGSVALLLACHHPELLASVAAVASPYPACQGQVPLLAIHGEDDRFAPYDGRPAAGGGQGQPPVEDAVTAWAQALSCDATPVTSTAAPGVQLATWVHVGGDGLYDGCGGRVALYTVQDGGHAWPDATFDFPREIAGVTTHAISANDVMLDFFEAHRR
jgi:polyhydroxybutyrate depolymerase